MDNEENNRIASMRFSHPVLNIETWVYRTDNGRYGIKISISATVSGKEGKREEPSPVTFPTEEGAVLAMVDALSHTITLQVAKIETAKALMGLSSEQMASGEQPRSSSS